MSDGIFKWYHASHEEAERWFGAYDNREDVIKAGRAEYENESFVIVEADRATFSFNDLFDNEDYSDLVAAIIDDSFVEDTLTRWAENEYALGEDGWEDDDLTEADRLALIEALTDAQVTPEGCISAAMSTAFEQWAEARRVKFGTPFMFGSMRNEETIPPAELN